MRMILSGIATISCCALVWATVAVEDAKQATSVAKEDACVFAKQLEEMIEIVSIRYVRPVDPADLLDAALRGLYETARLPTPDALSSDVRQCGTAKARAELILRIRESLGDNDALKGEQALRAAVVAFMKVLDPYSALVDGKDFSRGAGNDSHFGIGIEEVDNLGVGPLLIKTVHAGSPAQRAGIRPGDQITHIDGKKVDGRFMVLQSLHPAPPAQILGASAPTDEQQQSSCVELTLHRPYVEGSRKVALEFQSFRAESVLGISRHDDHSWNFFIDQEAKIAHVRLAGLGNGTSEELSDTITNLSAQGMRGLILDLRWSPGGYLSEAILVAQLFVGDAKVVTVKPREGREIEYRETRDKSFRDFPIIVLVNGETSGGAELVAAALQDNQRAQVAGQRTLGKGSVQTMIPLPIPNAGLKLTSGTFVRPNGENLHRFPDSKLSDAWGVRPDPLLEMRVSAELSKQLREWWLLQTLRPGPSNDSLPLDDPQRDPQRQAALAALREKLR